MPRFISVGNEIDSGMLHPLGNFKFPQHLAALLHSASSAIKGSSLVPQPYIVLHTADGWDKAKQLNFYKTILSTGTFSLKDFDVMAFSVYPFYTPRAELSALQTSLEALESAYPNKRILIAETDWPVSCAAMARNFPPDTKHIPISPEGQIIWMKALASILGNLKNALGVSYWEPGMLDTWGLGSKCNDSLLFQPARDGKSGDARISVNMFSLI